MLNKELLLAPKKESGPGYTHTITIGTDDTTLIGYNAIEGIGGVDPEFFLGEALMGVQTSLRRTHTDVTINGFLGVNQLYLGRLDTKRVVKLTYIDEASGTASGNFDFFTFDDVDTIIPIWVGENPPPLGLEDSLEGVAYVEQRATPDGFKAGLWYSNSGWGLIKCRSTNNYLEWGRSHFKRIRNSRVSQQRSSRCGSTNGCREQSKYDVDRTFKTTTRRPLSRRLPRGNWVASKEVLYAK